MVNHIYNFQPPPATGCSAAVFHLQQMSHIQQYLLVGCGVKDTSVRSNGVIGSSFWRASGSMCVASLPPFSFFLALQDSPVFQREMHSVSKSRETSIGPFRAMAVVISHTAEV